MKRKGQYDLLKKEQGERGWTATRKVKTALTSRTTLWLAGKNRTPIEFEVAGFNKKDDVEAVTTVRNGIKDCKISFRAKSKIFNRWIDNKRLGRKVSSSIGALILNYLEEEGK